MFPIFLLAIILNTVLFTSSQIKTQPRIINGNEAQEHAYPYQVAIIPNGDYYYCSGSLISETKVLTALTCLNDLLSFSFNLYFGFHNLNTNSSVDQQIIASKNIFIHEEFNPFRLENNIAIIELEHNVTLNDIVKIIKLDQGSNDHLGQNGTVTGWGSTMANGDDSVILRFIENPILSNGDCENGSNSIIESTNICLADYHNKRICGTGDLGSPLVIDGIQIGIGSFGAGNCDEGASVFTRVSKYKDWIKERCPECQFGEVPDNSDDNSSNIKISWCLISTILIIKAIF